MLRQGLGPSEAHGEADQLESVEELERALLPALDLERYEGTRRHALLAVHRDHRVVLG